MVPGQGSPGQCHLCGEDVLPDAAFINIGPTDWTDPETPKSKRYIWEATDIHGWTPFVVAHPDCFARDKGEEELHRLIDLAERQQPSS